MHPQEDRIYCDEKRGRERWIHRSFLRGESLERNNRGAGKNKLIRKDGGKKGILVLFARAGTADKILDPLDEIPEKHPPPFFSMDEKFERFSVNSSSNVSSLLRCELLTLTFCYLGDSWINLSTLSLRRNYELIFLIRRNSWTSFNDSIYIFK